MLEKQKHGYDDDDDDDLENFSVITSTSYESRRHRTCVMNVDSFNIQRYGRRFDEDATKILRDPNVVMK